VVTVALPAVQAQTELTVAKVVRLELQVQVEVQAQVEDQE
jgi:hypothetical protein